MTLKEAVARTLVYAQRTNPGLAAIATKAWLEARK